MNTVGGDRKKLRDDPCPELPHDISKSILAYYNIHDLSRFARVCMEWNEIYRERKQKHDIVEYQHTERILRYPSHRFVVSLDLYCTWPPLQRQGYKRQRLTACYPSTKTHAIFVVKYPASTTRCECSMAQYERVYASYYNGVYTVVKSNPHDIFIPGQQLVPTIIYGDMMLLNNTYQVHAIAIARA